MEPLLELTKATDELANLLQSFFERMQVDHPRFDYYLTLALCDPSLRDSVPAIKAAIRRRAAAQQAIITAAQDVRKRMGATC